MKYTPNIRLNANTDADVPGRLQPYGFTLVEVVMIIMILGIIASFALPGLQSGVAESKLAGAAAEITTALEYAQMVAMVSGEQTRVTLDPVIDTIRVERFKINGDIMGGASEVPENDIELGAFATLELPGKRGQDYYIVFAQENRFAGVNIVSVVFGAGQSVTFNAVGGPSNGGTVTLALGSRQVVLTLDAVSGKVSSSN